MGSVVNKVVDAVVGVTTGIVSGEYIAKLGGKALDFIGSQIVDDVLGLDSLGKEISRIGGDIEQVGKVLGGEYHDDMKALADIQKRVERSSQQYNDGLNQLVEKMESLVAFHEIFQMAMANRIDDYKEFYEPQLNALIAKYNELVKELKSEYDFVLGLTEGAFLQKIVGSIIMMIGGLMSDLKDIASGKANGDTWKRAVTSILMIIVVVLMWWNPIVLGLTAGATTTLVAATLTTITALMQLDGMYANGAATGAIMSALDFMFNDVLNLDQLIGSDFDKFDKDNEDYQEMITYTKLAMSLAAIYTSWVGSAPVSSGANVARSSESMAPTFSEVVRAPTELNIDQVIQQSAATQNMSASVTATSSILGVSKSTYSTLYDVYSSASKISDFIAANKAHEDLKNKMKADIEKLNTLINNKYRKSFLKHYRDVSSFLQDQQNIIDSYVWSMTAQNMYVDPYGTTPVANIRFTPDNGVRGLSFGFEDIFNESTMAGSSSYFDSILYGS